MPIHSQLTIARLEALVKAKPELLNETAFVLAYLLKLRPSDDLDAKHDLKVQQDYLDRLWAFVSRLAPVHNSLKAHVLYHRLVFDRSQNVWDADRFMAYLQLPRSCSYINEKYYNRAEFEHTHADLNANYSDQTARPPIVSDEALVRSYLLHFFVKAEDYDAYKPYVNDVFLRQVFAEAKITAGVGDQEKWASLLPPEMHQALKERIDLELAEYNKSSFAPDEEVTLTVDVKNVPKLIVKVYPINAMNYYRANLKPIGTDIDLDGLVANEESTYNYTEPPLRRVTRDFKFDTLKKPGLYIVEFIGNGRSSRALVEKGSLHYILRTGAAGQVFTILDSANKPVPDAHLWLAGHDLAADKDGSVAVPFSTNPAAEQPIILSTGNIVTLTHYAQQAEQYKLHAGFYVDREQLLKRRTAKLIVRPVLELGGERVSVDLLENVVLTVASTDIEGVSSVKDVPDFKLSDDKESIFGLNVPDNLQSLSFLLRAKVKNLSLAKQEDVADCAALAINGIDRTPAVQDMHLGHVSGNYFLERAGQDRRAQTQPRRQLHDQAPGTSRKRSTSACAPTLPAASRGDAGRNRLDFRAGRRRPGPPLVHGPRPPFLPVDRDRQHLRGDLHSLHGRRRKNHA